MYQIGRLCIKIAGRDARKKCLVIEVLDDNFVMIDGQTRRRKCNINHLEPLDKILKIKKSASHKEVVDALKTEKISVVDPKTKPKTEKPTKQKKVSDKKPSVKKDTKKQAEKTTTEVKKEEPKEEKPKKETKTKSSEKHPNKKQ